MTAREAGKSLPAIYFKVSMPRAARQHDLLWYYMPNTRRRITTKSIEDKSSFKLPPSFAPPDQRSVHCSKKASIMRLSHNYFMVAAPLFDIHPDSVPNIKPVFQRSESDYPFQEAIVQDCCTPLTAIESPGENNLSQTTISFTSPPSNIPTPDE